MRRKQILLPEWLDAYLKKKAVQRGRSQGEMLRAFTCLGVLCMYEAMGIGSGKELKSRVQSLLAGAGGEGSANPDAMRMLLSDVYFEVRKLTEEEDRRSDLTTTRV